MKRTFGSPAISAALPSDSRPTSKSVCVLVWARRRLRVILSIRAIPETAAVSRRVTGSRPVRSLRVRNRRARMLRARRSEDSLGSF